MTNWAAQPKECKLCGESFTPERWSQVYCAGCKAGCAVSGCERKPHAGGYCPGHWRQIQAGEAPGSLRKVAEPHIMHECAQCGDPFKGAASRKFCSKPCRHAAIDKKPTFMCATCGQETIRSKGEKNRGYNYNQRYCSPNCAHQSYYKGGRIDKNGYRVFHRNGFQVFEHREVMEMMIGRPLLPEETVHHIDGNRAFNDPANLELWSSRHGKGQRVEDKIEFCIEMLKLYPEFASRFGYKLVALESGDASTLLEREFQGLSDSATLSDALRGVMGC